MTSLSHRRAPDVNLRHALQLREYDAIADRIARDRPGRVLDWGCGWGQVTALLRAREHLDVEAFDFRPETGASGPAPLAKYPAITAYIETSDPVRLPYEDDRYDAVLSCGVLEQVGDPDGSLEELKRVLRPGGTLYVYKLPNRRSYLEAIAKRMGLYYHGAWPDDRVYDLGSARVLLERTDSASTRRGSPTCSRSRSAARRSSAPPARSGGSTAGSVTCRACASSRRTSSSSPARRSRRQPSTQKWPRRRLKQISPTSVPSPVTTGSRSDCAASSSSSARVTLSSGCTRSPSRSASPASGSSSPTWSGSASRVTVPTNASPRATSSSRSRGFSNAARASPAVASGVSVRGALSITSWTCAPADCTGTLRVGIRRKSTGAT
jgi:hypothetical protein